MIKRILFFLALLLSTPAFAQTYAIPDNGNSLADCVPGYICLPADTRETFTIGGLSFPPPWLKLAKPADLAAQGILTVVEPGAPTGNFASVTNSTQMLNGVPTVVYATTPLPTPTAAQQAQAQYNTALAAGLTITSAGTPSLNGVYAIDGPTQTKITSVNGYITTIGRFPAGVPAFPLKSPDGGKVYLFASTAEYQAAATAIADYVTALTLARDGVLGTWPTANATIP